MNKVFSFSIPMVIGILLTVGTYAQSPEKMSYQAVIRNSSNQLITEETVGIKISILQGSASGTAIYVETQTPQTNSNGLISIEIGGGAVVTGSFSAIDWGNGPYFIKTETDPQGGTSYTITGTSQLLSVPYALSSKGLTLPYSVSGSFAESPLSIENTGSAYYTIKGLSTAGYGIYGKTSAINAAGIMGLGTGADYSTGVIGRTGEGTTTALPGNSGVLGQSNAHMGVAGTAVSGIGGYFASESGLALKTAGNLQLTGIGESAGNILTSDASGNASWQENRASLILPDSISVTAPGSALAIVNTQGSAIKGFSSAGSGSSTGVYGITNSSSGAGVFGQGISMGIKGISTSGVGVQGDGPSFGIKGISADVGVQGEGPSFGIKGIGAAGSGVGVQGEGFTGIKGISATGSGVGVQGEGVTYGVKGIVKTTTGATYGLYGTTNSTYGFGLYTESPYVGVYGSCTTSTGWAGYFNGKVGISGYIGAGTAYPAYPLEVTGSANLNSGVNSGVALRCNGAEAIWYDGTSFSWGYGGTYNYFGDKVFIGATATDPGSNLLVVNGTAAKPGGGSWNTWSDMRLKDIQGKYERGLDDIVMLQPVKYSYRKDNACNLPSDKNYVGLVAQDVQKVFPEAVREENNGYLTLDMNSIDIAVINALKELKADNDRLKIENDELKARLDRLEKAVSK